VPIGSEFEELTLTEPFIVYSWRELTSNAGIMQEIFQPLQSPARVVVKTRMFIAPVAEK